MANLDLELSLRQYVPWTIKKTLQERDLEFPFLIPKTDMVDYILPELESDPFKPIKASDMLNGNVRLKVLDLDTDVTYPMGLSQLRVDNMPGNYYLRDYWAQLMQDRQLQEGDVIGLYWDRSNHQFCFSVISLVQPRRSRARDS
ncbi:PREDICTED: B3 domain-containing protein At1g10455-like [Camelina sativa]|uniref:B3 domain-containing protein At1g10455-like n=1 Tax=Camelina sativa TaxID=90675 RepID=A0ABM0V5C6_CAMSA|nr:PREDICTED: B3 domain-containing protein At1g10455-like [Camelina sativa]